MRSAVLSFVVLGSVTLACAHRTPKPRIQTDTVRIATRDTTYVNRVDTVRLASPPPPPPATTEADIARLRAERDQAVAAVRNAKTASSASSYALAVANKNLARAESEMRALEQSHRDSARVDGFRQMTEGHVYVFTVTVAKRIALPTFSGKTGGPLETLAMPIVGDSVKACVRGPGFSITSGASAGSSTCQVRTFADTAIRVWNWTVIPDTVDSKEVEGKVERTLIFTFESYTSGVNPDPEIAYPVTVFVRPRSLADQAMTWLTTTKGLLSALTAVVTAFVALLTAVGIGKRKGQQQGGSAPATAG